MKKLLIAILALSTMESFAKCETKLEWKLFSHPMMVAEQQDKYMKVVKELEFAGYKVTNEGAKLTTVIEAGVEKGINEDHLLSHIQVLGRTGKVLFEDYRSKKIAKDTFVPIDDVLSYVKKHVKKEMAICD